MGSSEPTLLQRTTTMDFDDYSDLTSSVDTSLLEVPTEFQRTSEFDSLCNDPSSLPPPCTLVSYEGVVWTRIKGFSVPTDDFKAESGIWKLGWRLYHNHTNRHWWLSKQCHLAKRTLRSSCKEALYKADLASSGAISHLKKYHNMTRKGETVTRKRENTMDDCWTGNGDTEAEAIRNAAATAYNNNHFKALLYDWIVTNNVSFNQLDSEKLRKLLVYLNPRCKEALPSHQTVSRTVSSLYDKVLSVVTETLSSAVTKLNFSFDLWTSKNNIAMLGLCSHLFSKTGKPITTLLALPRQEGSHTGVNIADTVSTIIAQYNLQDKLGYFTTDNASSHDTCLQQLGREHHFEPNERWIRCCGHVFNLVGQAALLGSDSAALPQETDSFTEESELRHWRLRGPIGQLHNLVYWINRSP